MSTTKQRSKPKAVTVTAKVGYSPSVLEEFKLLMEAKIAENDHAISLADQKVTDIAEIQSSDRMEEVASSADAEIATNNLAKLKKYRQNLQNALSRIHNKTYGVCRITSELVPIERLRANLIATTTVGAKEAEKIT